MILPSYREGQFTVSLSSSPAPQSSTVEIGAIRIALFTDTRHVRVIDQNGVLVGLLIGTPIDFEAGHVVRDTLTINTDGTTECVVEREIYRLAGSFLVISNIHGAPRIYLDANGTKSLVYDADTGIAGASAQAILDDRDYDLRLDKDLYAALDVGHNGWFPAGLTAHRGIERLMCNHYLDLTTFKPVRHWPTGPLPVAAGEGAEALVKSIVSNVTRTIDALARDRATHVSLTAGNESRLLAACCREILDQVDFFTATSPGSGMDRSVAQRVARRFGLKHFELPVRFATLEQSEGWDRRVGHGLTGANRTQFPTMEPFFGSYYVGGLGGEVGRGFLWLGAKEDTPVDAVGIVDRLKLPRHPKLVERIEAWLGEIDVANSLLLLDIAYMELRMSCWAYAQAYANPRVEAHHPLTSRRNFEAMLSLPTELRRGNGLIKAVIDQTWPELLDIPINRYGDIRDRLRPISIALTQPKRVYKKIRQLTRKSD